MKLIALLLGLSSLVNAQSLLKDAVSFRLGAAMDEGFSRRSKSLGRNAEKPHSGCRYAV